MNIFLISLNWNTGLTSILVFFLFCCDWQWRIVFDCCGKQQIFSILFTPFLYNNNHIFALPKVITFKVSVQGLGKCFAFQRMFSNIHKGVCCTGRCGCRVLTSNVFAAILQLCKVWSDQSEGVRRTFLFLQACICLKSLNVFV